MRWKVIFYLIFLFFELQNKSSAQTKYTNHSKKCKENLIFHGIIFNICKTFTFTVLECQSNKMIEVGTWLQNNNKHEKEKTTR